ncbi:MAG: glycosyltransferase family 4 protein [Gemmatimonadales bacterium]|nr:glycosyltransferase family 4 protein [Gemmatimonadales bacterium]
MRILFLAEGNPESSEGSFSGISKSLVDGLRSAGHTVATGDVDLHGTGRILAALPLFSPRRQRWSVRYHSHAWPARLRGRNAARHIEAHPETEVILQTGATFAPLGRGHRPYHLYCDSNIKMAERGAGTGFSWATQLTPGELSAVVERERQVYLGAAGIFTISEYLRQSFISDFGMNPAKVVTAGAGPNFASSFVPPERVPKPAGAPPTILFVGVQFERKGGDVLLRAFEKVRERLPGTRLLVVGPKEPVPEAPGLEWLGFLRKDDPGDRDRLLDAYREADLFCLPTRYEPFGIAYLEAMLFGLPCIGTNVWAVPEMVHDGVTGFLIPPDDAEALADRLLTLLQDRALAERFGRAGKALAAERFTWKAATERIANYMTGSLAR